VSYKRNLFLILSLFYSGFQVNAVDKKGKELKADDQTSSLYTQAYIAGIQARDKNNNPYGYGIAGRFDFYIPLDKTREAKKKDTPSSYGTHVKLEAGYGKTMSDPLVKKEFDDNWFPLDIAAGSAYGYAINSKVSIGVNYEMLNIKSYNSRAWAGSGWGFSGHYKSVLLSFQHERDGFFIGAFRSNRTFGANHIELRAKVWRQLNLGFRYTAIKDKGNPTIPEFRIMAGVGITE